MRQKHIVTRARMACNAITFNTREQMHLGVERVTSDFEGGFEQAFCVYVFCHKRLQE